MRGKTTWADLSEIVVGLMLSGKLSYSAINSKDLMPPYNEIHDLLRKRVFDPDRIIEKTGIEAYKSATAAAKEVDGMTSNWPQLLERASAHHSAGTLLTKVGSRLLQGEDVDLGQVHRIASDMGRSYGKLIQASKISPDSEPFVEIGWPPLDEHVGGLPKEGICTISADTGGGKTWLMLRLARAFGERKKKFAIFSLELPGNVLTYRMSLMRVPKKVQDYIYICDAPMPFDQIAATASQEADLAGLGVDFADLMVRDSTEQLMANLYIDAHVFTRDRKIPVVMLAQLRRTYNQALPTIQDTRWSGMIEKLSKLILLGHNPSQSYMGRPESMTLPTIDGKAYLIVGKSTHGFVHGGVGAIQIDWEPSTGWGDTSSWFPLVSV